MDVSLTLTLAGQERFLMHASLGIQDFLRSCKQGHCCQTAISTLVGLPCQSWYSLRESLIAHFDRGLQPDSVLPDVVFCFTLWICIISVLWDKVRQSWLSQNRTLLCRNKQQMNYSINSVYKIQYNVGCIPHQHMCTHSSSPYCSLESCAGTFRGYVVQAPGRRNCPYNIMAAVM